MDAHDPKVVKKVAYCIGCGEEFDLNVPTGQHIKGMAVLCDNCVGQRAQRIKDARKPLSVEVPPLGPSRRPGRPRKITKETTDEY